MRERVTIRAKNKDTPVTTIRDVELKVGKKVIPPEVITSIDIRVRPDEFITAEVELLVTDLDIDADGEVTLK